MQIKERVILHSDVNNFFASVECSSKPELLSLPVAVSGNPQKRRGIILAKNEIAKKYGVDYAIKKDRSVSPPKYLVFFKARDADALTAAFNEYSVKQMNRSQKPSVLKQLSRFKELAAGIPAKVRQKKLERDL